ncbi:MAG: L-histidine N(alpha)-methyltransferase [Desulfobacteraceae bacterium]|nr:L-histidine N(alpha)-methyltransferase [Desulfobacteraceae bacterium]
MNTKKNRSSIWYILFRQSPKTIRYIPVDISPEYLNQAARKLCRTHSNLTVSGIQEDFMQPLTGLKNHRKKLILFLGSTIGNLDKAESFNLLRNIASIMSDSDRLIIGMDMLKPVSLLEAAYNDSQGVTKAFNLNILTRLNREAGANFGLEDFEHLAFFNPDKEQIEMHLQARKPVNVAFAQMAWSTAFDEGETLHTEICRKYSKLSANRLFRAAGFSPVDWFGDDRDWFALVLLKKINILAK